MEDLINFNQYPSNPLIELFHQSSTIFYYSRYEQKFPLLYISSNVEKILGFKSNDFMKDDQSWLVEQIHPDDLKKVTHSYKGIRKTAKRIIDFRFKHSNGQYIWLRDEEIVTETEGRVWVIGTSVDITRLKTLEKDLKLMNIQLEQKVRKRTHKLAEQEIRYRTFSRYSYDAILEIDAEGIIKDCNRSAVKYFGYSKQELIGMDSKQITPEDQTYSQQFFTIDTTSSNQYVFEKKFHRSDGTKILAEVSTKKYEINGEERLITYIRDITAQKEYINAIQKSVKEKEVLLTEVHHRVKNNLAVISSLLELQIFNTEDPVIQESLRQSQSRILSMALIHEKLYQFNSYSDIRIDNYIDELIAVIKKTLDLEMHSIQIQKDLLPISLTITQAIPCGLLLNELLTNCFKHAFPQKREGTVEIILQEENNLLTLTVSDDGVGLPKDFDKTKINSLGLTIIEQLVKQLEGELNIQSDNGCCFDIKFYLE